VSASDLGATRCLVAYIAAGAERLVAGAGKHDYADGGIIGGPMHCVREFLVGLRPDSVALLGPADRDGRDAVLRFELDILVVHAGSPMGLVRIFITPSALHRPPRFV